jgi:hypothetical protein
MPIVAEAWSAGAIGSDHVDVLARTRRSARADDRFAEFEATFCDVARAGRPEDVESIAHQWRDALDAERQNMDDLAARQYESRELHVSRMLDGARIISGRADPDAGARIERAIEVAYEILHKDHDERTPEQQRIDALTFVCDDFLAGRTGGTSRPHLLLHTDAATLRGDVVGMCEGDTGERLAPETMRRLACDALISRVVHDTDSARVDLGRAVRTFTATQRRAIIAQYPTCVGVGCRVPSSKCKMHHIDPWEHGGRTDLINGAPVCDHDHRLLHEGHWRIERDPDTGIVRWYRPDGSYHGETERRRRPDPIPIRAGPDAA